MIDYYAVLQVSPDAEHEVVEAAYRRLARKYHPDVYKGADANERMRQLNQAFEILGDSLKRREYDQQRRSRSQANSEQTRTPPPPPTPPPDVAVSKRPRVLVAGLIGAALTIVVITILSVVAGSGRDDTGEEDNSGLVQAPSTSVVTSTPNATPSSTSVASEVGSNEFESNAIWTGYQGLDFDGECANGELFNPTTEADASCVEGLMRQGGASDAAVAFFYSTRLFMTDFQELGEVDHAVGTSAWVNQLRPTLLLLNGDPTVIYFADLITGGAMYQAIGDEILWPEYSVLTEHQQTDLGGQRLVFDVRAAPCRACETTRMVSFAVEIAGRRVIRVSQQEATVGTEGLGPQADSPIAPPDETIVTLQAFELRLAPFQEDYLTFPDVAVGEDVPCSNGTRYFTWSVRAPYPGLQPGIEMFNEKQGAHASYGAGLTGSGAASYCSPVWIANRLDSEVLVEIRFVYAER